LNFLFNPLEITRWFGNSEVMLAFICAISDIPGGALEKINPKRSSLACCASTSNWTTRPSRVPPGFEGILSPAWTRRRCNRADSALSSLCFRSLITSPLRLKSTLRSCSRNKMSQNREKVTKQNTNCSKVNRCIAFSEMLGDSSRKLTNGADSV
jgi:hypothetical protein